MTTPSYHVTAAPPRFRLQTFGTLRLVQSAGETVLGDHGHQRRRLALLAVLAASGERGRSRDQLLALFWPEVPQARARHSLDQLLYALRTSLDDKLFTVDNAVRLNSALIQSDVGDFGDSLARGELESAIALYQGPFLDGFYLTNSPAFEQWMEAERARIERSYSDALERLAKSLENENPPAVAPLVHKLLDIDPLSSKHAINLIRALLNAGDHTAALRYAERYEALVARELGAGVGPAVAALVADVRARAKTESVVVRGEPLRPPPQSVAEPSLPTATAPAHTDAPTDNIAPRKFAVGRRVVLWSGTAVIALSALAIVAMRLRPRAAISAMSTTASSIAVLPLVNQSADPNDAPLADGLTGELIARLAQITGLRVIASTSVFAARNRGMDLRQIADTLHVARILEGSLQKTGSRLRVQVRLLDARDASTLWSNTYNRELRDVFAVEDDIARSVVSELGVRLGAGRNTSRRQPPRSVAAYELYVRGSDRTLIRNDSTVRMGAEMFRQAIALDSTYAPAWAGLARMYGRLAGSPTVRDRGRYRTLGDEAALKAIALDDSLGEGHAALGAVRMEAFDVVSAEPQLRLAISLDPGNPLFHQWLSSLLLWTGHPAEALAEAQRALELDPLAADARADVARALLGNDRCDEALAELAKLAGLRPPLLRVTPITAQCYVRQRRFPEAIALLRARAAGADAVGPLAQLGYVLALAGQKEEARLIRATLVERWRRNEIGAFWIALVSAGFDDPKETCSWLDRSIADLSLSGGSGNLAGYLMHGPMFENVRGDPCFEHIRERIHMR